jgi:glycosyltransferase involved in cell wall biosynthesis
VTVSIVVPTRNRPTHAEDCVRVVLSTAGFVELLVVDQSDDDATGKILSKIADARLRYIRSATRGVTSGRNLGINLSKGDIVAFTDDDCRIMPGWCERITKIFSSDPDIAVVCGSVRVPDDLRHLGWAESFSPPSRIWQGRYPGIGEWGITANLSLRRSILEIVGLFDPLLGAGSPLRSGGEPDFLFRVLKAGYKVVNTRELTVDHLGIRQLGPEAAKLIKGYGAGTAAAFVKHIRVGDVAAAVVYLRFFFSTLFRVSSRAVRYQRPTGAGFLMAFMAGTLRSFNYRVDRRRRLYVS